MKILVFDYSGHPFQVQLSRELARRGHEVLHLFSASFQSPKGNLLRQADDPAGFAIAGLSTREAFKKYTFVKRRAQELEFGKLLAAAIIDHAPDVVISSNAPLDVQRLAASAARQCGARFVFWLQDIYSRAISQVITAKLPMLGSFVARYYEHLEFSILRQSDAVVAITQDFVPLLEAKGVAASKISVIENWAPLDDIAPVARDNEWAAVHMPHDGLRIVYSGTIGYKHNPRLLLALAQRFPAAHVYVFSEGPVVNALAAQAREQGVRNFTVAPWVPFKDLPLMLSAADIFVALIEAEAGVYSVPSKVLTYLTIGRAILASVPRVNLAARLLESAGAGLVAEPGDDAGFLDAAQRIVADDACRHAMALAGRNHALTHFDITGIGDRFEQLIAAPNRPENSLAA